MKKRIFFSTLSLLALILLVFSCQKEELSNVSFPDQMEENLPITALTVADTTIPLPLPDLIVSSYKTNVTATTSNCGQLLPDVSCYGQHSFTATAFIKNIGMASLPAGNLQVKWYIVGGSSQTQTFPHPIIPIGGVVRVSRPYYLGPCDCGPIPSFQQISFQAEVDPNDLIQEKKENNNFSRVYNACNGC